MILQERNAKSDKGDWPWREPVGCRVEVAVSHGLLVLVWVGCMEMTTLELRLQGGEGMREEHSIRGKSKRRS